MSFEMEVRPSALSFEVHSISLLSFLRVGRLCISVLHNVIFATIFGCDEDSRSYSETRNRSTKDRGPEVGVRARPYVDKYQANHDQYHPPFPYSLVVRITEDASAHEKNRRNTAQEDEPEVEWRLYL